MGPAAKRLYTPKHNSQVFVFIFLFYKSLSSYYWNEYIFKSISIYVILILTESQAFYIYLWKDDWQLFITPLFISNFLQFKIFLK